MKTPSRPPARARKGAGKAAAVKHTPAGTPTTQVRPASKGGTQKRRTEAPPLPHRLACNCIPPTEPQISDRRRARCLPARSRPGRSPGADTLHDLAYAGCRLFKALALTADRVDITAGVLVFESLKKRRTGIFRSVPVPPALLDTIAIVHGIRELHARRGKGRGVRLRPRSRMTRWWAVHAVMQAAGLEGVPALPKGLRHGFGVAAVTAGIPSRSTWCRNGSATPKTQHARCLDYQ